MKRVRGFAVVAMAVLALSTLTAGPSTAGRVLVQSFLGQADFMASPFYAFVIDSLPGGLDPNCAPQVTTCRQGDMAVPATSAGAPGNTLVTADVESAVTGAPTVFTGATDAHSYEKRFVSLGNESDGSFRPVLAVPLSAVSTEATGGYLGYDIAIIDLGENIALGSGSKSQEKTDFAVAHGAEGQLFEVGTVTNTGGDNFNVILIDLTGTPGIPAGVDLLYMFDGSELKRPQLGSLDVDGVINLNPALPVPALPTTWGSLKAIYR